MSRDYKNGGTAPGRGRPMGVGVLIGLLLGLCLALGVALIINKGPTPFVEKKAGAPAADPAQKPSTAAPGPESKTRFDFYKILPGSEEAVTDKEFKRAATPAAKEVYFLQVAAFQNPADADNLKAQLALAGIEAKIQTAQLPDGKTWHRVRIGPFTDMTELNASRATLKQNSMESNLIKVREPTQ
jgi:cell division protein FtsN